MIFQVVYVAMVMAGIRPMDTGLSSTAIMETGRISARSSASKSAELTRNVRRRQRPCTAAGRVLPRLSVKRMLPRTAVSRR